MHRLHSIVEETPGWTDWRAMMVSALLAVTGCWLLARHMTTEQAPGTVARTDGSRSAVARSNASAEPETNLARADH
ncbi:MAG: hypothetical protein KatS3mg111_3189 [Pirellulaceae bacterium]|nr:MAG: hypothetical protein KatS3mg111_3189 [Pirellulaceae bacterium]